MKTYIKLAICITAFLLVAGKVCAQGYDVFNPIAKYISQGDADKLSAWFAPNLEISVLGRTTDSSASQGKQIIRNFFEKHTPRSFVIDHQAAQSNMKYALGTLQAGAETYTVTIFVGYKDDTYRIQQLKIEKKE